LRDRLKESDFVYLIYVVETAATRRLRGVISLRSLLTADDAQRLEDLMDPYVAMLHPLEPSRQAAYRVISSQLVAMPVVGHEGQLLGVVTTAAAGNDAGGIATYAATGAKYGYDLIWVLVLMTLSLAVVQEMCAQLGAATGRGLLDLIHCLWHQRSLWDPEGGEPRLPARACLLYPVYGTGRHGGRRRAAAACADHPVAPVGPGAQRDGMTSHPRFHPAAGQ
jgi:Natural resistance-associated macrophage protein